MSLLFILNPEHPRTVNISLPYRNYCQTCYLGKRLKLLLTIDLPQHFVLSVLDGKIYRRNVNFRSNQDELTFLIILLESLLGGSAYEMPILRKD